MLILEKFGFRKGLFTENAAFQLTDNVLKTVNQKMHLEGYSVI
jgi:hypothetical protein